MRLMKGKIATSHDEAYLSTRAPQQELSTRRRRFFPPSQQQRHVTSSLDALKKPEKNEKEKHDQQQIN